jgi:hypothetical protein
MRELIDTELDAVCGGLTITNVGNVNNVGNVKLNLAIPTVVQTNLATQVGVAVLGGVNKINAAMANVSHIHL